MLKKRTGQLIVLGSILVIGGTLAGCQAAQGIGIEAAQVSGSRSGANAASVDPADRKFYMDTLGILGGKSARSENVNPADRKFYTDSLTIVIESPDRMPSVDPADRKFFSDTLQIEAAMSDSAQGVQSSGACKPIAPEDLLNVDPADRKFYLWSASC